jgi:two-component system LytT family response regulator
MIKSIIVENEQQFSDGLLHLLKGSFPEIDVLAICETVPSAIEQAERLFPEIVFLDVELPPFTGFDFLEATYDLEFEVIFTTVYDKYAVKAIEFAAIDYLLKPIKAEELERSINRYKRIEQKGSRKNIDNLLSSVKNKSKLGETIGIPVVNGTKFIQVANILFCEADSNYSFVHLKETNLKIHSTKNLLQFENLLSEHGFCRIHDKFIINLNEIKQYMRGGEGGVVTLSNGKEIDASRRRKDSFIRTMLKRGMIFPK